MRTIDELAQNYIGIEKPGAIVVDNAMTNNHVMIRYMYPGVDDCYAVSTSLDKLVHYMNMAEFGPTEEEKEGMITIPKATFDRLTADSHRLTEVKRFIQEMIGDEL